jgi:hypothetical protein
MVVVFWFIDAAAADDDDVEDKLHIFHLQKLKEF